MDGTNIYELQSICSEKLMVHYCEGITKHIKKILNGKKAQVNREENQKHVLLFLELL